MISASECRRQADLHVGAAEGEGHTGIRNALFALALSWRKIADQLDQLAELRARTEEPAPQHFANDV